MTEKVILRGGERDGVTFEVQASTRHVEAADAQLNVIRYERTNKIEGDAVVFEYRA